MATPLFGPDARSKSLESTSRSATPGAANSPDMCPWDVLILITAWNVRDFVLNCLRSIFAAPIRARFKVAVLDDGGSDNLKQVVGQFPQVDFIRSEANLGFIKANNKVLRAYWGQARYFLLLNADTTVEPGAIDSTADFLEAHPGVGIAGCKVIKPGGTLDWPCKRSYVTPDVMFYRATALDHLFPKSRRFGKGHLTYLDENEIHEVDFVVGAYLMIRQETLEQIGVLDEDLFMYGDDYDWCFRAKRAGWQVFYAPTGTIHHKTQSNRRRSYRMIFWLYHSTWIIYRKHIAGRYSPPVNALVCAGVYTMCVASLLRNIFRFKKGLPSRQ